MKIVKLEAALKDYIWGGENLKKNYNKKSDTIVAEAWLVSCHKDGPSIISEGEYKGKTLNEYINIKGKSILGTKGESYKDFPLLIKFLDAKDNLSIQVHPDNDYALKHENEYGKNEMWVVLDCEPNAFLYYGVNKEISREDFKKAIEEDKILDILNKVYVKPYDVFNIKAGTIHAVGAGMVIAEIQQSSNSTYRVYDFNRKDANGNSRPLHIDKAVDVSILTQSEPLKPIEFEELETTSKSILLKNAYFTTYLYRIKDSLELSSILESFQGLIVTRGSGKLVSDNIEYNFEQGDSFFIEANASYKLIGECEVIIAQV